MPINAQPFPSKSLNYWSLSTPPQIKNYGTSSYTASVVSPAPGLANIHVEPWSRSTIALASSDVMIFRGLERDNRLIAWKAVHSDHTMQDLTIYPGLTNSLDNRYMVIHLLAPVPNRKTASLGIQSIICEHLDESKLL